MSDQNREELDDAAIAKLLRQAGKRDLPPAEFAEQLRASLKEEWLLQVEQRARSRRRWSIAGAAVAAVALFGVGLNVWLATPERQVVARVVQSVGAATQAPAEQVIHSGDRLTTGADSRMAIVIGAGISLRLDENTEVLVDSGEHLTISRGAVYVDAGKDTSLRQPLTVQTAYGSIRHLGTQYEVRLLDAALSVCVREGRIVLDRDDAALQGTAGEQLLVSDTGNVERLPVAADAPTWNWIAVVTPVIEIDNRPLTEFLTWAGRELGREVVFASPAAQAQAGQVILRGSVTGLTPDQAVDAVLASTPLTAERAPGTLQIRD